MITDNRSQPNFRILTCNKDELTLFSDKYGKIIYRESYNVPKQNEEKLFKWLQLSHPYLLSIHQIQRILDQTLETNLGISYEHYAGSLQQYFTTHGFPYDQQQIINTFAPILEAIEYLEKEKFNMSLINLSNILITQNQQIKFIDQTLLYPNKLPIITKNNQKSNISSNFKVYQQLSALIYNLLVPELKGKNTKSWKTKLQILHKKVKKHTYEFFISIFNKSLINAHQAEKSKKIAKGKREKKQRIALQCKQNQLVQ